MLRVLQSAMFTLRREAFIARLSAGTYAPVKMCHHHQNKLGYFFHSHKFDSVGG